MLSLKECYFSFHSVWKNEEDYTFCEIMVKKPPVVYGSQVVFVLVYGFGSLVKMCF